MDDNSIILFTYSIGGLLCNFPFFFFKKKSTMCSNLRALFQNFNNASTKFDRLTFRKPQLVVIIQFQLFF